MDPGWKCWLTFRLTSKATLKSRATQKPSSIMQYQYCEGSRLCGTQRDTTFELQRPAIQTVLNVPVNSYSLRSFNGCFLMLRTILALCLQCGVVDDQKRTCTSTGKPSHISFRSQNQGFYQKEKKREVEVTDGDGSSNRSDDSSQDRSS